MQYDASTYERTDRSAIPEADYPFTVINASESVSQNGNDMVNLELAVEVGREKPLTCFDNLVAAPKALWKIEQFCLAVGLDFNVGDLTPDECIGRTGKAHFSLQTNNKNGKKFLGVEYYIEGEATGKFEESPAGTEKAKKTTAKAAVPAEPKNEYNPDDPDGIPF